METELQKRNILRLSSTEANAVTRECIESALILLMKEKKFSDISISDIVKRAGVSRNAYYRNYSSKENILSGYLRNIIDEMKKVMKQYDPIQNTMDAWMAMLGSVRKHSSEYQLLLNAGYGETILMEYQKSMNASVSADNHELYFSNCYWAGALISVISEWIRTGMQVSEESLAEIGTNLMHEGISTIENYGNRC